jgi:hypothetical protein
MALRAVLLKPILQKIFYFQERKWHAQADQMPDDDVIFSYVIAMKMIIC